MASNQLALPRGSLIVVSGANGLIGSNIVDQLLLAGYHVRGTVRSLDRTKWMLSHFDAKYGKGKFSLIEVLDMAAPSAYTEAVKGAAGLVHVATPVFSTADPNEGIQPVVDGTINALEAASNEASIKRVVLTSSSTAASNPQPNKVVNVDTNSWNEDALKAAWAPPPYEGQQRVVEVYAASKMEGEKAAWEFMRETKPSFVLNAVLPNMNFGNIVSVEHQGYPTSASLVKALWAGGEGAGFLVGIDPQWFVDVQDDARLHVAALIYEDVKAERLFAFAQPFNWNDILAFFRKLYPGRKFHADFPDLGRDLSKVANERAEELLKRFGQPGWTSLEDSIKALL
ncbi:NAD(P)-binding protein [Mytilinidion resinicola]|uniref:NAD(P)-binding protein n=1 Tax=Mytilinidion resinicola TaxID=574789 RepID=A0A6A6Z3J0_9PEZI|nr:NAD(P)-binding protein [Mytilinidion resinicola]KAF2814725.1 NAD(P)-binding protein [Mytilinidion resinicola]